MTVAVGILDRKSNYSLHHKHEQVCSLLSFKDRPWIHDASGMAQKGKLHMDDSFPPYTIAQCMSAQDVSSCNFSRTRTTQRGATQLKKDPITTFAPSHES